MGKPLSLSQSGAGLNNGVSLRRLSLAFFSPLLLCFKHFTEGVYLHTRSDGKLFNLARLRAKTKVRKVLIRELLFADDATPTTHKHEELQQLISQFSHTCKEFGLTISIRKTEVTGQDVPLPLSITIYNQVLEVADHFTYWDLSSPATRCLTVRWTSPLQKLAV